MSACTKAAESVVIAPEGQVLDTAAPAKKARKMSLTSPRKMGAAKKSRRVTAAKVAEAQAKVRAKSTGRQKGEGMWAGLRTITREQAQKYADMLAAGTTPRAAETETGLNARQRMSVEKILDRAGFKLHRELNTSADKADGLQRFRYRTERAEQASA